MDTVFEESVTGLRVTLANGNYLDVKSEKHEHPDTDPMPYYDECRTRSVTFPDGAVLSVDLCSGQGNYYAGCMLHDAEGEVIYESEDPIESFAGPIEIHMNAEDGRIYLAEIEWEGEDPFEETEYSVVFTVNYVAKVRIVNGQSLEDAISDIDIPESDAVKYTEDTFEVLEVWKGEVNEGEQVQVP